ncbi:MAG: hypothetical protein ACJA1A_002682 [Saprospiraceae bacterium]
MIKKGILLFFNVMFSAFIYGHDHVLSEYTFNNATQALNSSKSIVSIVAEKKFDGDLLESTNEHEKFCIYSHYYLNNYIMRKYARDMRLWNDAMKIFTNQANLTEK